MKRRYFSTALLFLIMCAAAVQADVIHLKSGGQIQGEITEESAEFLKVRLQMGGTQRIPKDQIERIEEKKFSLSPSAEYKGRKRNIGETNAQGHYELALFCMRHRMYREAIAELNTTLKLDANFKDKVEEKIKEVEEREKSHLYDEAVFYSETHQYQKAIAYLDKLMELYPKDNRTVPRARKLKEKITGKLDKQKILGGVDSVRSKANKQEEILLLGVRRDSASLEALIDLTSSRDPETRATAIDALSLRKDEKTLNSLMEATADKNAIVREKAARALGKLGGAGAVESIIQLLSDRSEGVREEAATTLGKIGSEKAVSALAKVLRDANMDVRLSAIEALGKIGDSRATRPLVSALGRENLKVRVEIYDALGAVADPEAVKPLLSAIRDERVMGQEHIIRALGQIGDEPAVDGLIRLFGFLKTESLLEKLIITLRRIENEKVVPAIAAVLKHSSPRIQEKAASTLGLMKDKRAIPYLKDALRDPSDSVRIAAAKAIQNITE